MSGVWDYYLWSNSYRNNCSAIWSNTRKRVLEHLILSSHFLFRLQSNLRRDWLQLNCGAPAEQTAGHSCLHPSPMKNGRPQANVTSPHHILGLIAPVCACVTVPVCVYRRGAKHNWDQPVFITERGAGCQTESAPPITVSTVISQWNNGSKKNSFSFVCLMLASHLSLKINCYQHASLNNRACDIY